MIRGILGIDPGLDGGLVLLGHDRQVIKRWVMPVLEDRTSVKKRDTGKIKTTVKRNIDICAYAEIMLTHREQIEYVILEQVSARPDQGVSGMFKFGFTAGIIEGVLAALKIPYLKVAPVTWTKELHKDMNPNYFITMEAKERSRHVAKTLFPEVDLRENQRCKNMHDGLVDGILLAEYGLRKHSLGAL